MTGFLLDTNVPSELTRPKPQPSVVGWLDDADDRTLFLSVITIGEIFKGITVLPPGNRRQGLQDWLQKTLLPWFSGRILPIDEAIAERWGVLSGERQLRGKPLTIADGFIAATALQHGLTVVTRNVKDFSDLGVRVLNLWDVV